jgi:hypothetical protein
VSQEAITADIGDGRQIIFTSKQDAMLFVANFSSREIFMEVFKQVYGTTEEAAVLYNYYRADRWRREVASMLRTTLLSDGSILFDSVKKRIKDG